MVPGLSNIVPQWFKQMFDALKVSNDITLAFTIQDRINELWKLHLTGHWLSCLKMAASSVLGIQPYVQSPLSTLDEAGRIKIDEILTTLRIG